MRKYLFVSVAFLALLFAACGSGERTMDVVKEELKVKKNELTTLRSEINKLEKEIAALDPEVEKRKKLAGITVVTTQPVQKKNFEGFVEIPGSIETKGEFKAAAQMGGYITSMRLKEGDRVRRGQLVATIDSESMESSKVEIQTRLKLAKDVYERRARLWEQGIGSEIEYLNSKTNVEALENSIASLETQMAKTKVYAPSSGEIDVVYLRQGELASPGMPIISIVNLSSIQVVADVPENYLSKIKERDQIMVSIPNLDIEKEAKVTHVSSRLNPQNRTFKIEAQISNRDGKLKPNMSTSILMKDYATDEAIVVPTNLIQQEGVKEFVFVMEENDTAKMARKIYVDRGRTSNTDTQILSGLEGDELLIAEGYNLVKDGAVVRLGKN